MYFRLGATSDSQRDLCMQRFVKVLFRETLFMCNDQHRVNYIKTHLVRLREIKFISFVKSNK